MAAPRFDQVNIVVADVRAAAGFLRALGVVLPDVADDWAEWATHHQTFPSAPAAFDADLDSPQFASHWGGLPAGFTGVVVNLRVDERDEVDRLHAQALTFGATGLHEPYDAFWGARYSVGLGPGPIAVGLMSAADPDRRGPGPSVADFS